MKTPLLCAIALTLAVPLQRLSAHDSEAAHEMSNAAQNFLQALNPEQRSKAQMDVQDTERKNWHFIPRARKGLPVKEMTQAQRLLAQALLVSGLSSNGYEKAVSIMSLEDILANLEKGSGPVRDPENYYVTIFGQPGGSDAWGWRVEGHHLSLNFAASKDQVLSMTPSFFGTNPGEVKEGQRAGLRILADEEELGRSLVKSLTEDQRKVAVIQTDAPKDVLNVPGRNDFTKPEGLAQTQMTPEQQAALAKLIHEYLNRHRLDVAADDWAQIEKAGLDKVTFAWAGGLERGQGHYYRVQGPTFILEYDNTQNNANHVHSLWREIGDDFGGDLLKQHYQQAHSASR
ncbi:DUF3500 domain-containing protein [Verrucomicrobiota bacterium sgz303538]